MSTPHPSRAALFAYGTPRDRDVLELVLGREVHDHTFTAAVLEHHRLALWRRQQHFRRSSKLKLAGTESRDPFAELH